MFERRKWGAVDAVRGDVPLNQENVQALSSVIDDCCRQGQPRIVIDLERIPLIDSAGLELLLDVRDRCLQRGGLLKLAAPKALCRDILTVTGLTEQIEVLSDAVTAVGSFAQ
jgi:anti-sigma B factor antagonist